jgi:hypothetical protein
MSPTKRTIFLEGKNSDLLPLKRLRGGGGDDDEEPAFEELFVDDLMDEGPEPPEEFLEEEAPLVIEKEEHLVRWKRPDLPLDLNNQSDLNVQWIDMDVVSGKRLEENPNPNNPVRGGNGPEVPVLRCYGVNEAGHSVAVFVHGFTPYSFFALPAGYELTDLSKTEEIRQILEERLKGDVRSNQADSALVHGVEYIADHRSIMGYETQHTKFLKVFISLPGLVPTLKRIMEGGIHLPGIEVTDQEAASSGMIGEDYGRMTRFAAFECNVPFVLRFMVDWEITGAGWLTLPGQTYQIREKCDKLTHCQVRGSLSRSSVMYCFSFSPGSFLHFRLKSILPTKISFHKNQKASGTRLRPCESFRWILNVKVGRDTFLKPSKILSSKLPTRYPYPAKTNQSCKMFLR